MRSLVWAFAGRTYHIVGNLMSRLKYNVIWHEKVLKDVDLSRKTELVKAHRIGGNRKQLSTNADQKSP